MEAPKFNEARLLALKAKFESSGKDIDTFLHDELHTSRHPNADAVADGIIGTLSDIDANYADIRKTQSEGYNRRDWLNRTFNAWFRSVNPKTAGELLSRTDNAVRGDPDAVPEETEFIGREARELVANLDESLEAAVVSQLADDSAATNTKESSHD